MDKFDSVLIYLDVVDNSRLKIHTNSSRDIIAMIALRNIWVIIQHERKYSKFFCLGLAPNCHRAWFVNVTYFHSV